MAPEASPVGLEVQCAGCGETLEVDPGLTEFICPDCATPQSLPPELMPPPPPRRKALPLPRAAADVRGARLPCGSCGALLSVPVGLARCSCPVCGAELAIDTARLRHYLLSSATAEGATPVVPVGDSSAPPILQAREVRQEHPNFGIGFLQTEPDNRPNCMEQVQAKRPNLLIPELADLDNPHYTNDGEEVYDVNGTVTRHTKQTNIHTVSPGTMSAEKRHEEPPNHARHQAQVQCSTAHINCTTGQSTALQTATIEKRQLLTPNQIIQQAQKQSSGRAICTEDARAEGGDGVIHVQEKQQQHVNNLTEVVNEVITGDSNRRGVRCTARRVATGAEKRKVHETNGAIKQVPLQQSDSVNHMESENHGICVEKEQPKSSSCRILKRKKKGLTAASNSGLQPRRSKRLAKDSPTTITNSEPTESDPDEQHAGSPDQSLSYSPSPPPRHEESEPSSNELDSDHLATPPSYSHIDMSDPEQFARDYIPPEVKKALANLGSNSLFEHTMSQARSGESDSEGEDPLISTRQNVGTKGNHRRSRNLTLCLNIWTLPKGVRIPVSLNTSGEPVGKEAGTLSSFLCALARDGVLAPLIYQEWRRVPEINKDIMWRIVKLKFDIAAIGELWVIKSLGKRWRSWKSILKTKHYDTHETEEERLADRNPRVLEEQWRFLVAYWSTEKAMAASARNRACQANAVAHHTAGTKSFARIIEEEKQKRPDKDGPSVTDLFILTHTPKNGKPTKKATADIIARLREDSQKRTEGSGSDPTALKSVLGFSSKVPRGGKAAAALQASVKEAMEAKQRAEDEADALKKKMMAMEENQRKMQEDLANMKSTVSAINKTVPTGGPKSGSKRAKRT